MLGAALAVAPRVVSFPKRCDLRIAASESPMSRDSKKKSERAQTDGTARCESPALSEQYRIEALQAAELALQDRAEQTESFEENANLPAVSALSEVQAAAMEPALQAFWMAVLPLIGTHASRPGGQPA